MARLSFQGYAAAGLPSSYGRLALYECFQSDPTRAIFLERWRSASGSADSHSEWLWRQSRLDR